MGLPIDEFVVDRYVRSTWIAFFTLFVLWAIVYALRHIFQNDTPGTAPDNEAAVGTTGATTTTGTTTAGAVGTTGPMGTAEKKILVRQGGYRSRLDNAHRVLFENTLLLLSVLVLNTVASGSTHAVYILAWIYFAFTVVYAFTVIGVEHRFIRLIFSLVFLGITLAIGGLAFHHGFTNF